jgi:hypothetical protein
MEKIIVNYKLHISPNSQEINKIIIVYPGLDAISTTPQFPSTSNNLEKYNLFSQFISQMSSPNTAVIAVEYPGPHAWGSEINFEVLTDNIKDTLQNAMEEINSKKLIIDVEKVDLFSHSYGFVPLFWSLANNILNDVFELQSSAGTIDMHLFEPYGMAAMKSAKENSAALREYDVLKATRAKFVGIDNDDINPTKAAQNEIKQLKAFDDSKFKVKNINIILGLFRPSKSIHESYGNINPEEMRVNLVKLSNVGHGGALVDMLKAQQDHALLPDYAAPAVQSLLEACICSLNGIKDDASKEVVAQKVMELCIKEQLILMPKAQLDSTATSSNTSTIKPTI